MATIDVPCPNCGARLKAPAERIGTQARCTKCQHAFRIPGPVPLAGPGGEPGATAAHAPDPAESVPMAFAVADGEADLPPIEPAPAAVAPKAKPPAPAGPIKGPAERPPAAALAPPKVIAATPKAAPTTSKPAAAIPKADATAPKAAPKAPALPTPKAAAPVPPVAKPAPRSPATESGTRSVPLPIEPEEIPNEGPEPPKSTEPQAKAQTSHDEPEPVPEPVPGTDDPFSFGFTSAPGPKKAEAPKKPKPKDGKKDEPEPPRKKKARDEEKSEEEVSGAGGKNKKPTDDEPEAAGGDEKPRYRRPEPKAGMTKSLALVGVVGLLAVGLAVLAAAVYMKNNRPEEVKKEEKKEEPVALPPAAPPVAPPVAPVAPPVPPPKAEPNEPKNPEPKPKDKPPEPKATNKGPAPAAARAAIDLGKLPSFGIGKEPAKFEAADLPAYRPFEVDTAFASVVRVFPPFDPKSSDTYIVARNGAKLSLDAYSPSSQKQVSRLEFAADPARPVCDVYATATEARFLAVSNGRISVWNLADQKSIADGIDPYADKPEHQLNGLAAAFFSPAPDQIVTVSTAGAVHLFDLAAKKAVTEFVPPHGAKGKVAPGESVARAEGGASIVLAVGGILYQIKSAPGLEQVRTHDLKGDVRPLAVAAGGTPGRLLFAFETEPKGKKDKDRALLYLPLGAAAKPVLLQWPAAFAAPGAAFWANETTAAVVTARGAVWFDEDENKFAPVVVTQATGGGLYTGAGGLFWYAVPRRNNPTQSVVVPLAIPFGDAAEFRGLDAKKLLRTARIDQNGLSK